MLGLKMRIMDRQAPGVPSRVLNFWVWSHGLHQKNEILKWTNVLSHFRFTKTKLQKHSRAN